MINVSRWSIQNPIPVILFFITLTILGLFSFNWLKIKNMPDISMPMVIVTAVYPGASPAIVETEVANKIENGLSSVAGIKHIYTTIVDGVATIIIEFPLEKDINDANQEVHSAVSSVRASLPLEMREPIINKLDYGGLAILSYAIFSAQRDELELSELIEDSLKNRLSTLKNIGQIVRVGGVEREIKVELNPVKMQALGLTSGLVSRQLKATYSNSVAGKMKLADNEQKIRIISDVVQPNAIANLEIPILNHKKVKLNEIAKVYETTAERTAVAFLDGKTVVGFEIIDSKNANQLELKQAVEQELEKIKQDYPDLTIVKALDLVEVAEGQYHGSLRLLIEGGLLTILIVWLFLRDIRCTVIAALALPLSIIPTYFGIYYFDFSLNTITFLALSLVIGILVDDAIVEAENIVRHLRMGKTPYQAAVDATDEIGLAVIATTMTIIAVFLPTAFMTGIGGLFFRQFGWTASIAVFMSLVVARMLTPMLAAYGLKPVEPKPEPKWLQQYTKISKWCLLNRGKTILLALAFFLCSLGLIKLLPGDFVPADDNDHTQVRLELPPGSNIDEIVAIVAQAEHKIADIKYIEHIYTTIGAGSAGANVFSGHGSINKATITIRLIQRNLRPHKNAIERMIKAKLDNLPGVRFSVGLGISNNKYKFFLISQDKTALRDTASAVENQLRDLPGINGFESNNLQRNEVAINIDFARAAQLGVTSRDIADAVKMATEGDYDENLAKFNLPNRQIPIRVEFEASIRNDLTNLNNLSVMSNQGPIRLAEVAQLELTSGYVVMNHLDKLNSIEFTIYTGEMKLDAVRAAVNNLAIFSQFPASVTYRDVGEAEAKDELSSGFAGAMLAGGLLVYIFLVLLFKDFLQPFTILIALPLATGGSFVLMLLTRSSFSIATFIGFIMLMGIVTKNSILLVEYTLTMYRAGKMSRTEALLDACRKRARPIIMTSFAMSAGMLPVALKFGDSDMSFSSPMAVAIIGGLTTSTLLSLLVIPSVFSYMDDFEQWLKKKFKRT